MVESEHFLNRRRMALRRCLEHSFDCTRNAHERDASFEECSYSNLISGIQSNAVSAANFRRFVGQAKTWETLEIRLLKFEVPKLSHIKCQL